MPGEAKAFPNGFKMIARGSERGARMNFHCVRPRPCLDGEDGFSCEYWDGKEFPTSSCRELEVSMIFPSCWDGVNLDSEGQMEHVAYNNLASQGSGGGKEGPTFFGLGPESSIP